MGILPGIARRQLLTWLKQNKQPVRENIWTPEFVKSLRAIAYSNCVVEVIPLRTVISSGEITQKYQTLDTEKYLQSYFRPNE